MMTARDDTVIQFPRSRASHAPQPRWPRPCAVTRAAVDTKGNPVRRGDRVAVWSGTAADPRITHGIVSDIGMTGAISHEKTYTVICGDGITRVVMASHIATLDHLEYA